METQEFRRHPMTLFQAAGVVALMLLLGTSLRASPVLFVNDASGQLGRVDVATGATTVTGSLGAPLTDIAFNQNSSLYGVSSTSLYSIISSTGQATLIGDLGISGATALVFGTDGTLYAAGGSSLFTVDPATGAATSLGDLPASAAGDLAFNDGTLYLSSTNDSLVRIDLQDLAGSAVVGPFGFAGVLGMATGDDGVLYGISGTQVFAIDTATGAGTLRTNYAGGSLASANGAAFVREAVIPLPSVGLLMPTALCALLGRVRVRRSRSPAMDGLLHR